jgi:hypothetical protein
MYLFINHHLLPTYKSYIHIFLNANIFKHFMGSAWIMVQFLHLLFYFVVNGRRMGFTIKVTQLIKEIRQVLLFNYWHLLYDIDMNLLLSLFTSPITIFWCEPKTLWWKVIQVIKSPHMDVLWGMLMMTTLTHMAICMIMRSQCRL